MSWRGGAPAEHATAAVSRAAQATHQALRIVGQESNTCPRIRACACATGRCTASCASGATGLRFHWPWTADHHKQQHRRYHWTRVAAGASGGAGSHSDHAGALVGKTGVQFRRTITEEHYRPGNMPGQGCQQVSLTARLSRRKSGQIQRFRQAELL